MDKQAREARKMAKDLPFSKKVAYIWEYYKYWILGGLFLILAIGGTVYTIATRPTYDMTVGYYSEQPMSQETVAELEAFLEGYVEDYDGNGEVKVRVNLTSLATLGNTPDVDYALQQKLFAELASGTYPIILVDGMYYDLVAEGSFADAMESLRDMSQSPLADLLPEGIVQPFWCTRAIYGPEEKKEERILEHQRAIDMEVAIFGEREE